MAIYLVFRGAQSENRTRDLRITNALLYRLSYLGALDAQGVMLSVGTDRHDGECGVAPASGSRPFHVPVDAYGSKRANISSAYQFSARVRRITST